MRVGKHSLKRRAVLPPYKRHRIIMPVYIPHQTGYYKDMLEIFEMCLCSLLATVDLEHVSITMIDNGSMPQVGTLLSNVAATGQIDRHIRNAVNRGKPDALVAEIKGSYERFVTIADCDALFLPGWLAQVESIYRSWPRCGAVSPGAQPKPAFRLTVSTWLYAALRMQLRLTKCVSDEDMREYALSVGNEAFYEPHELAAQYAVCDGTEMALMGAQHFVITYRRAYFDHFQYAPRLEGDGLGLRQFETEIDRRGGLRLSNTKAYVLHMGNTPELWMRERLAAIRSAPPQKLCSAGDPRLDVDWIRAPLLPYKVRRLLAKPIILAARVYQKYIRAPRSSKAATETLL